MMARRASRATVMTVDGLDVTVLRRNVRNMIIRVQPPRGDVEATANPKVPVARIVELVREHRDWILVRRRAVAERYRHTIALARAMDARDGVLPGDEPELAEDGSVWTEGRERRARARIERSLPGLLAKWIPIIGREPTSITVRRMKTRWGSCSVETGRIRINLHLGLVDERLLEGVLVHELTHLRESGHGPAFQRRMDAYLPDWRERDRELNRMIAA